jgi:hypothetical protein
VTGGGGGSSLPAWLWISVGALGATLYHKAVSAVRGGPAGGMGGGVQGKMAGMMMEQMMKQAMKQQAAGGGPGAGGPGLGGMGAPPPFPGFPGFPPPPPPQAPSAASAGPASASPPIDTTAGPPAGSKFAEAKAREAAVKAATAGNGSVGAGSAKADAPSSSTATPPPASSSSPTTTTAKAGSTSSAFKDVADEPAATGSGAGAAEAAAFAAAAAASTSSSGASGSSSSSGASGASGSSKFSSDLVDQFFRDPSVQEMLYQHLPEPMRNPATFEWVLNNPENRAQLEAMIEAQGASLDPRMQEMLSQIDNEEVGKRLESLGVTPADMLSKIMGEPDLAAAIQKPAVMKAIMEMQTNPMAFLNYQSDPDVMLVMNKLTSMFNPAAAGAGIPGMPGKAP